jgi:hypothetical protein
MGIGEVVTDQFEQKTGTLVQQAKALKIVDQASYDLAADRLLGVAALRREIVEHHAPMKQKTHAAWQEVLAAEKKLLRPVEDAEALYRVAIAAYDIDQRRLEREARERAEAEARRVAEEQREHEVEQAEAQGADAEEVAAICNAPLMVEPPRIEPTFQPARGVSVAATWKGEVTSLELLVKAIAAGRANISLVQANEVAINQLARATRGTLQVPGIRFFSQSNVRAGRR